MGLLNNNNMLKVKKIIPIGLKRKIKEILNISPTKELDINRLSLIKESSISDLQNHVYMEDLLNKLGLNDEELFNYPKSLYSYCGQGLFSWQYPSQFSKYLIKLSTCNISSYLEIGVKHGGTFMITTEYLNKICGIRKAVAIDLFPVRGLINYRKINKKIKSIPINSRSKKFEKLLIKEGPFDLTLIDGDHSYEGCLADFELVKKHSKIIAFHDIVGMGVPGVIKVWNDIKVKYQDEYDFFEFIDQYEEVVLNTNKTWLGIGLAIKKNA